jgi:hypothetical protein
MKKLKLKIDKEYVNGIFLLLLKKRGLLFVVFWGIILIYSFNIIYKKAYIDINFIAYPYYENFTAINKENITLRKITEDMDSRKENLKNIEKKTYRDPFNFKSSGQDGENIDQSSVENVSIPASPNNASYASGTGR